MDDDRPCVVSSFSFRKKSRTLLFPAAPNFLYYIANWVTPAQPSELLTLYFFTIDSWENMKNSKKNKNCKNKYLFAWRQIWPMKNSLKTHWKESDSIIIWNDSKYVKDLLHVFSQTKPSLPENCLKYNLLHILILLLYHFSFTPSRLIINHSEFVFSVYKGDQEI